MSVKTKATNRPRLSREARQAVASPGRRLLKQQQRRLQPTRDVLPLANCHSDVYMGNVQIGPLSFLLEFDLGSADTWVLSDQCADCPPYLNLYAPQQSKTYQTIAVDHDYEMDFGGDYFVGGTLGRETFVLGSNITLTDAVFAQVESVSYQLCQGQEGMFGLGPNTVNSAGHPSLVSKLAATLTPHPLVSLYLTATNDYPEEPYDFDPDNYDPQVYRPNSFSSKLILGGVDHKRYHGCLTWVDHFEVTTKDKDDEAVLADYWKFQLDAVRVNGVDLPSTSEPAILDSASTFILGPLAAISQYIDQQEGVECVFLDMFGEGLPTNCDGGFDIAIAACDAEISPLEIVIGGVNHAVTKESLLLEMDFDGGVICVVRLMEEGDYDGWILGNGFLNQFYIALDLDQKRIGFAASAEQDDAVCPDDWNLDIAFDGKPAPSPPVVNLKTTAPTASPVSTTVEPPKISGGKQPSEFKNVNDHNKSPVAALAIVIGVVLGAVLMVTLITARRRKKYRRANAVDYDEVELPRLL